MKQLFSGLIILFTFFSTLTSIAQIDVPVTWESKIEKTGDDTFQLVMKAEIIDGWYLYTQEVHDDGPIPTAFTFEGAGEKFELVGEVTESESLTKYDKIFEMDLSYFKHDATFTQNIKIVDPTLATIVASVDFQSCDDEKCIFEFRKYYDFRRRKRS